LIGGDHLTGSASGISLSQDGLAFVVGGGVEVPVRHNLSVRSTVDYALTRHNIFGGPSYSQNNIRVGLGFAYTFGRERSIAAIKSQSPGVAVTMLGVRVVRPESSGARIVALMPGGIAERVGLRVDDIIDQVNGVIIHGPDELATILGKSVPGAIQIGYLVEGEWQTKITVSLGVSQ
jgi:S1-C subfamily serine protease